MVNERVCEKNESPKTSSDFLDYTITPPKSRNRRYTRRRRQKDTDSDTQSADEKVVKPGGKCNPILICDEDYSPPPKSPKKKQRVTTSILNKTSSILNRLKRNRSNSSYYYSENSLASGVDILPDIVPPKSVHKKKTAYCEILDDTTHQAEAAESTREHTPTRSTAPTQSSPAPAPMEIPDSPTISTSPAPAPMEIPDPPNVIESAYIGMHTDSINTIRYIYFINLTTC